MKLKSMYHVCVTTRELEELHFLVHGNAGNVSCQIPRPVFDLDLLIHNRLDLEANLLDREDGIDLSKTALGSSNFKRCLRCLRTHVFPQPCAPKMLILNLTKLHGFAYGA